MEKTQNTKPKYPGIRLTTNGNQLVSYYTEARVAEAGVFYPITPSTEMGENFQMSFANGELNVFGDAKIAIETEGEHSAQGGAIAASLTGKRAVNFTSGQGIVYGCEQYYHAPGKLSTMVLEVSARTLTKSALNVHCGHDDIYAVMDTGWTMLFAKDAQQAADQALIIRKVNEKALTPGINIQDGFLTSHLERTFLKAESDLIREYLGAPGDIIDCPTDAQKELFGPKRRRVPEQMDLKNPMLLGPVQNQEHYMNGVVARRDNFVEPILGYLEEAYAEFAELTGRDYGLISSYNCENADTVFVALGSAAENIEAAVDYLKETRNENVGVIHVNVIRPFPEAAVINALKGKKRAIILERIDDQMASDNPLARDIRTALTKALENSSSNAYDYLPAITADEMPRLFSGVYGLGSRDFRPEGILGAYEFATGKIARQDGKKADEGTSFFYVGVNHPYNVQSAETPSLLPENAIALRMHSIGGWGMITTGKNLSEIIGELSQYVGQRDNIVDENGNPKEVYHISANPKYGSEKKGAPTNYFLVAAPERIRVNCDLQHVNAVICCDPKAFTHTNPLAGLTENGALIIESSETDSAAFWQRIPARYRQEILDKKIRIFCLDGFQVAKEATNRPDLQFRMQGNAFLGAFFKVSTFLQDNNIPDDEFLKTVEAQYNKKFGRFGAAVVDSNMKVMRDGFEKVWEVEVGAVDAPDTSSMRGESILPVTGATRFDGDIKEQPAKTPISSLEKFDGEFRSDYGYNQPASPLASTGAMPAATAATTSKYVSRRSVPIFHPEKCTQCMDCITVCPDTAMPNTAQDISTVIGTAIKHYVADAAAKEALLSKVDELDGKLRTVMFEKAQDKKNVAPSFGELFAEQLDQLVAADSALAGIDGIADACDQAKRILNEVPVAYAKARPIFEMPEKKNVGDGGVFSIMISDHCKGCGECVVACGSTQALSMEAETEEINGKHNTEIRFLDLLPETSQKYLGKFDAANPQEAKAAMLKNHLMVRSNYDAIVSGDGACAGCGEKSILRGISTITEAYMRPLYTAKANRLDAKAKDFVAKAGEKLAALKANDEETYKWWTQTVKHAILGLGGENDKDSEARIAANFEGTDETLVEALDLVLRQDAFNHRDLKAIDGRYANGMSTMMMSSCTGCNSVYSSTHPNNPHTYPWMNSLFQDASTLAWLFGESMIVDHAKRSVIPERLVDIILNDDQFNKDDYFLYTHFSDTYMTAQEVAELPKVWAVGGDGAMGDIGFQNLSKVMLQNRPNVHVLMLDTQVYSNTGGQNSDSSVMPGGFDMNQHGAATEGKLTERKEVSSIFTVGHGSPFVGHVSMANAANFFKAVMDGLVYRGTAYIQAYTSCQPEHGVADDMSATQAGLVRDSRAEPEFVFNPSEGELYHEAFSLKGNPDLKKDWRQKTVPGTKEKYNYTIAHWAVTEPRFRKHVFKVKPGEETNLIHLDDMLAKLTQDDVVNRRFLDKDHRAFVPTKGVYIMVEKGDTMVPMGLSRQLVLFCVERRKNWRQMQSRAGIVNEDYLAQKEALAAK